MPHLAQHGFTQPLHTSTSSLAASIEGPQAAYLHPGQGPRRRRNRHQWAMSAQTSVEDQDDTAETRYTPSIADVVLIKGQQQAPLAAKHGKRDRQTYQQAMPRPPNAAQHRSAQPRQAFTVASKEEDEDRQLKRFRQGGMQQEVHQVLQSMSHRPRSRHVRKARPTKPTPCTYDGNDSVPGPQPESVLANGRSTKRSRLGEQQEWFKFEDLPGLVQANIISRVDQKDLPNLMAASRGLAKEVMATRQQNKQPLITMKVAWNSCWKGLRQVLSWACHISLDLIGLYGDDPDSKYWRTDGVIHDDIVNQGFEDFRLASLEHRHHFSGVHEIVIKDKILLFMLGVCPNVVAVDMQYELDDEDMEWIMDMPKLTSLRVEGLGIQLSDYSQRVCKLENIHIHSDSLRYRKLGRLPLKQLKSPITWTSPKNGFEFYPKEVRDQCLAKTTDGYELKLQYDDQFGKPSACTVKLCMARKAPVQRAIPRSGRGVVMNVIPVFVPIAVFLGA